MPQARAVQSLAILSTAGLMFVSATALAHPIVEQGRQQASDADFDAALASFAAALEADGLTREDLIQLYETRAYVYYATGNREALQADVARLAALDPEHGFEVSIPPEVSDLYRTAVDHSDGRLSLDGQPSESVTGVVEVRAIVTGDAEDLVRRVRIFIRTAGGPWAEGGNSVQLPSRIGESVEWYAEALGPGGAVVANIGSATAPMHHARNGDSDLGTTDGLDSAEGDGVPLWVWIAGGAGIALVTVLAIVLLAGESLSDDTQPSGPIVTMP